MSHESSRSLFPQNNFPPADVFMPPHVIQHTSGLTAELPRRDVSPDHREAMLRHAKIPGYCISDHQGHAGSVADGGWKSVNMGAIPEMVVLPKP